MTNDSTARRGRQIGTRYPLIVILAVLLAAVGYWLLAVRNCPVIDAGFATGGRVRYHCYPNKPIDAKLRDDDLAAIKSMLVGRTIQDSGLSCGFGLDIAVVLTDGRRSIAFCPALDGDPLFRIDETDAYLRVSDRDRRRFDAIVRRYGMREVGP